MKSNIDVIVMSMGDLHRQFIDSASEKDGRIAAMMGKLLFPVSSIAYNDTPISVEACDQQVCTVPKGSSWRVISATPTHRTIESCEFRISIEVHVDELIDGFSLVPSVQLVSDNAAPCKSPSSIRRSNVCASCPTFASAWSL